MALIYGGNIRAGVPINKRIYFVVSSLVEMHRKVNGKRIYFVIYYVTGAKVKQAAPQMTFVFLALSAKVSSA